jgi:hypothetical protein
LLFCNWVRNCFFKNPSLTRYYKLNLSGNILLVPEEGTGSANGRENGIANGRGNRGYEEKKEEIEAGKRCKVGKSKKRKSKKKMDLEREVGENVESEGKWKGNRKLNQEDRGR